MPYSPNHHTLLQQAEPHAMWNVHDSYRHCHNYSLLWVVPTVQRRCLHIYKGGIVTSYAKGAYSRIAQISAKYIIANKRKYSHCTLAHKCRHAYCTLITNIAYGIQQRTATPLQTYWPQLTSRKAHIPYSNNATNSHTQRRGNGCTKQSPPHVYYHIPIEKYIGYCRHHVAPHCQSRTAIKSNDK